MRSFCCGCRHIRREPLFRPLMVMGELPGTGSATESGSSGDWSSGAGIPGDGSSIDGRDLIEFIAKDLPLLLICIYTVSNSISETGEG